MKKIISWAWDNILFLETLFLLVFIPLYPKLPLVDIKNTWVYIRAEDFVVVAVIASWVILLLRKKISLRTPLTLPILIFWIIGAIATIHGVVLIFPSLPNVFPNVAFLSYLRHIEYMSLFFIAYSGVRDKKSLPIVIAILTLTLLAVIGYGVGQKYLGFPAYLTMNEQYAKGVPIQLSDLSRIPSTFAGHYDLAAYLVLILPILASMIFGFRNLFVKLFLLVTVVLGFGLLATTVSRVSFFALLIVFFVVLFFQKKRFVFYALPLVILAVILFLSFKPTLLNRFGNTVREVDVLVDGGTGNAVGEVKFLPSSYFKDKIIKQKFIKDRSELDAAMIGNIDSPGSSPASTLTQFELLPPVVPLVTASNVSNGENLPQGTGYINLSLSPVIRRVGNFFYELAPDLSTTTSAQVLIFHGNYLVKRAAAYDLSFTTRFQGEWPNAIAAFERDVIFGSGYGSVSLAIDNNYFRMLAETGLLGILSFFIIFLALGIYITKTVGNIESKVVRSFVIGFAAGVIGLAINATLIDVFEASKIAYILWILVGVTVGVLALYHEKEIDLGRELTRALTSTYAVAIYLAIGIVAIFSPLISNFFVGDDFTWFRWAADYGNIWRYFIDSGGFFYRPGTKIYFQLMYQVFWLNPVVYHVVSIVLHSLVAALFFILAKKILGNKLLAALAAVLFVVMSGYHEIVFWTSATGSLVTAVAVLSSLLFFISWEEKKKPVLYAATIVSMVFGLLFHELGIVAPLLLIAYKWAHDDFGFISKIFRKSAYLFLFSPIILYLVLRLISGSHWFGGDYSYNILKLPLNVTGNILGYILLILTGPMSLSFYEQLRNASRSHIVIALIVAVAFFAGIIFLYRKFISPVNKEDKKILFFGSAFFIISLIPFLGFGNIASRYSYLASLGLIIVFVFFAHKFYLALLSNGKNIALASTVIVFCVFSLLHVIQIQQIHGDWRTAGGMSKKFFVSIDDLYSNYWSSEPVDLRFVNVPLRSGAAWVFPVGLPDALWLTFRNDDLKVYIDATVEGALAAKDANPAVRVFVFNDDGSLKEASRVLKGGVRVIHYQ